MIGLFAACAGADPPVPAPASAPAPTAPTAPAIVPGPDLVGLCDASAAVSVGAFLVVANDEVNTLHVFDAALAPAGTIALATLAPLLAGKAEADLEGMATLPDGTTWITGSHDAGRDTERKPSRQRLFAVRFAVEGGTVQATLAHGPTDRLIDRGQASDALREVVAATAGHTSKDPEGLSIEGLAAAPDGALLFGFRAPVRGETALVVRLDDPVAFAAGRDPVLLSRALPLDGRGIRSIEHDGDGFLLVAGPAGDGDDFALYRWSGGDDAPIRLPVAFGDLRPEALVRRADGWWVLSDDGTRSLHGTDCKDLPGPAQRARTARISVP